MITGYASISETNRRQKHIPKISERNHAGTSFGKPFRTGGNCIHVKLQQNILASSYKRPTSDMAFPVADDEGFGQSQIPLPSVPPIKSANYLCFKLSSKQCLNCNLSNRTSLHIEQSLSTGQPKIPNRLKVITNSSHTGLCLKRRHLHTT